MDKRILTLALILILTGVSSARYISLSTSATTERIIRGNSTSMGVRILNSGDEAAYNVRISLLLPEGFSANELEPGRMEPDEFYEGNFTVDVPGNVTPGTYPVAILTDYGDANLYPFSSVTQSFINIGEMTPSDISGTLSKIRIDPEGSAVTTLRLRNHGDKKHTLKVRLFLPREIETDPGYREIELGPRESGEIKFRISSFGALAGSTYIIFASMEYEVQNLHHTSTTTGIVEIINEDELPPGRERGNPLDFLGRLDMTLLLLLGSFFLFIIIFIALSVKSKNEEQREDIGDNPDAERGEEYSEGAGGASRLH